MGGQRERESFYFGPNASLFGTFHPPQARTERSYGLLFCYPMGQEYMRFHRAYVQLAGRLARAGFPVLRFDYFGCGDSYGAHEDARFPRWLDDTAAAIDELKRRASTMNVCMVGARIGASISLLVAQQRSDVQRLVLWNPIVNGVAHRDELENMQDEMVRYSYVDPEPRRPEDSLIEILGYPFGPALWDDLQSVDLLAGSRKPADDVLVLDSATDPMMPTLSEHLERLGTRVALHRFDGPRLWLEEPYKIMVPNEIWQDACTWLTVQ